MTTPGFAAESSLYPSTRSYRPNAGTLCPTIGITPQAARSPVDVAIGDLWRDQCARDGGSRRACCNDKQNDCTDDCGDNINCRGHCKQRGDQCRGIGLTLGSGTRAIGDLLSTRFAR
jgi:hypothetical protein